MLSAAGAAAEVEPSVDCAWAGRGAEIRQIDPAATVAAFLYILIFQLPI
jgi:hypothetical protein